MCFSDVGSELTSAYCCNCDVNRYGSEYKDTGTDSEGESHQIIPNHKQYVHYTSLPSFFNFCARQHICYSAYMLSSVRLSVCLSVCHTIGSVKNG